MNRIAGILNLDHAPVRLGEIDRMLAVMRSQGHAEPLGWVSGGAGLGCTGCAQSGEGGLWAGSPDEQRAITFDGRIDNRQDLLGAIRTIYPDGGARISDARLVLAAYEKWGVDCPKHLTGDFAFAIWDAKEGRLLCARDHFGVKPFYYFLSKESFVFGSTPYALLASWKVPPVIHEERIADLLAEFAGQGLEGVDKTSSFYKDVFRLPPAHLLIVQRGGMRLERYWELCPKVPAGLKTEEDQLEAFQELFGEAVRCRLEGLAAPASMLSGGMDSSAIVGAGRKILAEAGRAPLHAFAVVSNYPGTNRETSYIASVVEQGGLQPHLISESEVCQRMDTLLQALEAEAEPFDCLMNLNRAVYLHAREQDISALLDGVDGDVLLSDSGQLLQLWRAGACGTILEETWKAGGLTAEYKLGRKLLLESFLSTLALFAPGWMRSIRRGQRYRRRVGEATRESLIAPEFAVRSRLGERLARLDSHSPRPPSITQLEYHKIALDHPFLTAGLERYERVATSFGVEPRHPLTDVRLAEFCLGLPWQLKSRGGWTKLILRRALEAELPSRVIWRKDKDSLMWEINRLVLKERLEYLYQVTWDEQADLKPYLDLHKLMNYWHEYIALGDEGHAELIWSGVALAMWLRHHKDMTAGLS